MKRCDANHYYDETQHIDCPYCTTSTPPETKPYYANDSIGTEPLYENNNVSDNQKENANINDAIIESQGPETVPNWNINSAEDNNNIQNMIVPVVGWLVIIDGPGKGIDRRIISGMNSIGRDINNTICIDFGDNTISRNKHCTIIYDYKNKIFFLQHGDGSNLTYLNDSVVLQPTKLENYDEIFIGNTKFKFVSFCSNDFNWDN
jgi:hypothetical protein